MRVHHVGIATKSIEKTIEFLEGVAIINSRTEIVYDPLQDARLCMLQVEGMGQIELIEGKVVEKLLKKQINLYHICYEVEDIKKEKQRWIAKGALLVSDEKCAVLFDDRKVVFLMSNIGMVELLESGDNNEN